MLKAFGLCLFFIFNLSNVQCWSSADKVKLKEVETLTLYDGKWTNGRRSPGVPQLKCVGGTASCQYTPKVVQCYNRGFDGYDVQWECKADMDNSYGFGQIQITCEGYDNPNDPYILKGSCGLEYTIDYTKEGNQKKGSGQDYGWNIPNDQHQSSYHEEKGTGRTVLLFIVGVIIVYAIYKTCIAPNVGQYSRSFTNDDHDSGSGRRPQSSPPPAGFRSDYYPSNDDSCSGGAQRSSTRTGSGGGGFWSGAATGGLLGYMFGSRNGTGTSNSGWFGSGSRTRYGNTGGWGGSGFSSGYSGGHSSSSSSSGSRNTSGFGGTSRR